MNTLSTDIANEFNAIGNTFVAASTRWLKADVAISRVQVVAEPFDLAIMS